MKNVFSPCPNSIYLRSTLLRDIVLGPLFLLQTTKTEIPVGIKFLAVSVMDMEFCRIPLKVPVKTPHCLISNFTGALPPTLIW
jgi:hypothetical protein